MYHGNSCDVNNMGNWGVERVCGNSVLSYQFFCKCRTALKKESRWKNKSATSKKESGGREERKKKVEEISWGFKIWGKRISREKKRKKIENT